MPPHVTAIDSDRHPARGASTQAVGAMMYLSAADTHGWLAAGGGDRLMTMNTGNTAPQWRTLSATLDLVSGSVANGDMLVRSSGSWQRLAIGANGNVLTVVSGGPAWAAGGGGGSLDNAYDAGNTIVVDAGSVQLNQAAAHANPALLVQFAGAVTGIGGGIYVDLGNAASLNNANDIIGIRARGLTNAGAGNSIGLLLDGIWDVYQYVGPSQTADGDVTNYLIGGDGTNRTRTRTLYDASADSVFYRAEQDAAGDFNYARVDGVWSYSGTLEATRDTLAATVPGMRVVYTALAYTGTPHGILVDWTAATSLSNAADVYGVNLIGETNAGAGDSVALRIDGGWDVAMEIGGDAVAEIQKAGVAGSSNVLGIVGNQTAAGTGADVDLRSAVTRTAGFIARVRNNTTNRFTFGYGGQFDHIGGSISSAGAFAYRMALGAWTAQTASTEVVAVDFDLSHTVTNNTGALATQRDFLIRATTHAFGGASTITDAGTLVVTGPPIAGSNATITNPYTIWAQAGNVRFDGNVLINHDAVAGVTDYPFIRMRDGDGAELVDTFLRTNRTANPDGTLQVYSALSSITDQRSDRSTGFVIGGGTDVGNVFSGTGIDADASVAFQGHENTRPVDAVWSASIVLDASVHDLIHYSPVEGGVGGAGTLGANRMDGAFKFTGVLSPAQITANQNNYNPSGLDGCVHLRINADAARNITGIVPGNQPAGRFIIVTNTGTANNITFTHEDTNSTAANRFDLANAANVVLNPRESIIIYYDNTSTRWRVVSEM